MNSGKLFDASDPAVKLDILRMIVQYLHDEGYNASFVTLQDEACVRYRQQVEESKHVRQLREAVLQGDWGDAERLSSKRQFRHERGLVYAIAKQQYLELVEKQELQKAFAFLNKRLKALEGCAQHPEEFQQLCYLLSCRTVQEAPLFREWDGAKGSSRERLVGQFPALLPHRTPVERVDEAARNAVDMPPQRLLALLQQAVGHQVASSRCPPRSLPAVATLLTDYEPFVIPATQTHVLEGHKGNVKCVGFVGAQGRVVATGSSDNTARLWSAASGAPLTVLLGHSSRVWDLASTHNGGMLATASADASVRLWDVSAVADADAPDSLAAAVTLVGHAGDVYSVAYHPDQAHVVTGGYDRTARLFSVETGAELRCLRGHLGSVCCVAFNACGNLVATGSKDNTIQFWDIRSGLSVQTYRSHLGEVTSVAISARGDRLLSASKDNSNRLWDMRTGSPLCRYKGHQNTSRNFVRAAFGPREAVVLGGSEDGYVYVWDTESADITERLPAGPGVVYNATWTAYGARIACSCDRRVALTFE